MTAQPYILARNLKEAHAFARGELGLAHGRYRVVNSSSIIRSARNCDLYLVPGWQKRYDHFVVQAALRWTRMNKIDVAAQQAEAPDPRGELTEDLIDLAYAEDAVRSGDGAPGIVSETDDLNPPGVQLALVSAEEATSFVQWDAHGDPLTDLETAKEAVTPKPKNRRRSRCKECGNLHFRGDPCPDGDG